LNFSTSSPNNFNAICPEPSSIVTKVYCFSPLLSNFSTTLPITLALTIVLPSSSRFVNLSPSKLGFPLRISPIRNLNAMCRLIFHLLAFKRHLYPKGHEQFLLETSLFYSSKKK